MAAVTELSFVGKKFLPMFKNGVFSSEVEMARKIMEFYRTFGLWISYSKRVKDQLVIHVKSEPGLREHASSNDASADHCAIIPAVIPCGTVSRRAVEKTWMTASNSKKDSAGSEFKSLIEAPVGYKFVGADVDSEELWIASLFGESLFEGGIHGASAIGWMTLQGSKQEGTDLHSRTAQILGISRNEAKVFNYSRIYGSGKKHAMQLLMQVPGADGKPRTEQECEETVVKLYEATKGVKRSYKSKYAGGSESFLFNYLEKRAGMDKCRTPILSAEICNSLACENTGDKLFLTTRMNWIVQSSAVDFLHCLIVSMDYLMKRYEIGGRLAITIHDEIRYLVAEEDVYRASLALQISHLWTRALFCERCDFDDLPMSVAFFSLVDVDSVLRKETYQQCLTPTQKTQIEAGKSYEIKELLDKLSSTHGGPDALVKPDSLVGESKAMSQASYKPFGKQDPLSLDDGFDLGSLRNSLHEQIGLNCGEQRRRK